MMSTEPSATYKTLLLLCVQEIETIVTLPPLDYILHNTTERHYFIDQTNTYYITMSNTTVLIMNMVDSSMFLFHKDLMVYQKQNYFHLQLQRDQCKLQCTIHDRTLHSTVRYQSKTSTMTITMRPDDTIYKKYNFVNSESNLRLHSHTHYQHDKIITVQNKDGLISQSTYERDTHIERMISYCMITDNNTGLRHRGTYEHEQKDNTIIKKTLSKDNTIVYHEEENRVTVDLLRRTRKENEIVIGWKVAKSESGELRLVKLGIPVDAEMVMAIDYEFFHTRGKERCNKAIVMDIQLVVPEEEVSVVPHEMIAYSFLYRGDVPFPYTVGSLVVPDEFNPDQNESCTKGIHFYQNRQDVFDSYISRL